MTEVIVCCDFSHKEEKGSKEKGGLSREVWDAPPHFPPILFTASGIQ